MGSVAIWRLRFREAYGIDSETMAEVDRGRIERQATEMNPEIELVTRPPTTEALKEATGNVYGEAAIRCRLVVVRTDGTGASPLRATLNGGFVIEKFQYAADGDPVSDCRVVDVTHDLRLLVLAVLLALRFPFRAACCSARYAR